MRLVDGHLLYWDLICEQRSFSPAYRDRAALMEARKGVERARATRELDVEAGVAVYETFPGPVFVGLNQGFQVADSHGGADIDGSGGLVEVSDVQSHVAG